VDEVLTVTDVAKLLKCSRTVAYELVMSGQIASFKIGKLRRVRRSDVDTWLASRIREGK
jgi:excisionase family DNA binding protein